MGEKIKDLYPIHIGSSELMIELNEGYSNEGRVIHVQNKKFRYLFKENDFLKLSSNILRSKSELDYIRNDKKRLKQKNNTVNILNASEKSMIALDCLCEKFEQFKVQYRIVEIGEKFASVIVSPEDNSCFKELIKANPEIVHLQHPYGKLFGYVFLYQMNSFQLYKYQDVYFEIYFQLPCMSLTANTWIPLDKKIQSRVWSSKRLMNKHCYLDNESYLIFKICWAIFKDGFFSDECANQIKAGLVSVDENTFKDLLSVVFFEFTDDLYTLLIYGRYDEIVKAYFSFTDY